MSVERRHLRQQFGQDGGEVIADTNDHTDLNFQVLQFGPGTEITSITAPKMRSAASLVGKDVSGMMLATKVTQLELASGFAIGTDFVE